MITTDDGMFIYPTFGNVTDAGYFKETKTAIPKGFKWTTSVSRVPRDGYEPFLDIKVSETNKKYSKGDALIAKCDAITEAMNKYSEMTKTAVVPKDED